jgi:NAD(P)-dependent dehydrogenase (short-subunit alcohol dehydrogenase family)
VIVGALFDLSGIASVVTGASRGIGLALTRTLLHQGARVMVNGYDSTETVATASALEEQFPATAGGPRVAALAGDAATLTCARR